MIGSILLTQIFVAVVIVNYQRAQGQVLTTAQMIHRSFVPPLLPSPFFLQLARLGIVAINEHVECTTVIIA